MWNKILRKLFKKEPDAASIKIERTEVLLMVRLGVNGCRCAHMQCVVESSSTILIGDILHQNEATDYNKGYGTLMMEHLLVYAKEHGYSYIYGNLSEVDLDHKERLHHFYQKFGFTITEYPEPQGHYYGKIELHLNQEGANGVNIV